jgi:hypothetical protein
MTIDGDLLDSTKKPTFSFYIYGEKESKQNSKLVKWANTPDGKAKMDQLVNTLVDELRRDTEVSTTYESKTARLGLGEGMSSLRKELVPLIKAAKSGKNIGTVAKKLEKALQGLVGKRYLGEKIDEIIVDIDMGRILIGVVWKTMGEVIWNLDELDEKLADVR